MCKQAESNNHRSASLDGVSEEDSVRLLDQSAHCNPREFPIPAATCLVLLQIGEAAGMSARAILEGTNLTRHSLENKDAWISVHKANRVLINIATVGGVSAVGIEYGLRMRTSWYGMAGVATANAPTMMTALRIACKYTALQEPSVRLSLKENPGGITSLVFSMRRDIKKAYQTVFEGAVVGIWQQCKRVADTEGAEIWVNWKEPHYFAEFRDRLPPFRFDQSQVELRMPTSALKMPLVTSNPVLFRQALRSCDLQSMQVRHFKNSMPDLVRAEFANSEVIPSLAEVARGLNMSTRSVQRKLTQAGVSFKDLAAEARIKRAQWLLENTTAEIKAIAADLGYSDPTSFRRAFKRWTGHAPSALRG